MADIFISYAKADRPLALKLAAMLEAEGWTTWWDTSLTIGDDFRNEIMTELGRARAVIVIWTDTSIKSDWVRSEAGRAQADRKLIPVKLPHLVYEDLPPPFDVLHTEDIGQEDKIKAAVVAQLAKPAAEPTAIALLAKGFRYEVLTWWGIIGGAVTLFSAYSAAVTLAPWASKLVDHWKEWTHAFWVWVFGWLGIHLPPVWTSVLSFLLFGSLLTIGQAIQSRRTINASLIVTRSDDKSFKLISWRSALSIVCILIIAPLVEIGGVFLFAILTGTGYPEMTSDMSYIIMASALNLVGITCVIVFFARQKLHAAVATFLLGIFWGLITFHWVETDTADVGTIAYFVNFSAILLFSLILLSVAPAKAISRRLIFLALGLLLLITLNELSKLGLI
jgi:hypothetical protein